MYKNDSSGDFIKRLKTVRDEGMFCRYMVLLLSYRFFLKFWCVSLWLLLTLSFISMDSSSSSGNWLGTSYGLASD